MTLADIADYQEICIIVVEMIIIQSCTLFVYDTCHIPRTRLRMLLRLQPPLLHLLAPDLLRVLMLPPPVCACVHACVSLPVHARVCVCACTCLCNTRIYIAGQI